MYGAEYETNTVSGYMSTLHNHDVPCAVCLVRKRFVVRMFPGKKNSSKISETLSQDSKLCFGNRTNITKIYVLSNTHILHNLSSTILIKTFYLY